MMLAGSNLTLSGRVTDVSVRLSPGEVTAICGPNGAGKSSLLAVLAGLIAPGSGTVSLDANPLDQLPAQARAQAIGFLPQSGEVAWDVSVETLASLGRLPWRSSAAQDAAAAQGALAALQLEALRERPLSQLSGGERARALLARVLAGEPRWLLADEPLESGSASTRLCVSDSRKRGAAEDAARSEQFDVVVGDLGRQVPAGHQIVVEADLVAAMLLGVVQRLIGLAQDFDGRTARGAHETQAHRHLAHLREVVLLHGQPEAVEHLVGSAQRGGAQQHHKLFAAKAEDAVVAAK